MGLSKTEKAELLAQERLARPGDERMAEWCVKSTAGVFVADDGTMVTLGKPSIQTRFCFGYSDYDGPDACADAHKECVLASESEDYFMRENLRQVRIPDDDMLARTYVVRGKYASQPSDCLLGSLVTANHLGEDCWGRPLPEGARLLSESERDRLREACQMVRDGFERRLRTYLKRYGLSKCDYWTYWRDE